jgi:uncharacterized membrane protein YcaP (DUF421 family)
MDWKEYLFDKAASPDTIQMVFRAVIVCLTALIILRAGARRTFGNGTSIDNIVVIMLGGMLSRVVTGAAAFFPVTGAVISIVILHRLLSWLSMRSATGKIINGTRKELFANGEWNKKNIKQTLTNEEDLFESLRLQINTETLEDVDKIYIERNGILTVIKKK